MCWPHIGEADDDGYDLASTDYWRLTARTVVSPLPNDCKFSILLILTSQSPRGVLPES